MKRQKLLRNHNHSALSGAGRFLLALMFLIVSTGWGLAQKTITGTVTGTDKTPLPGVSLSVVGTTTGTITDINGKYSLSVPSDAKTILFTFVGMEPKEVSIGTGLVYDVTLNESLVGLNEVVVVGYGTQKKINLTGAVDQIGSKALKDVSVSNVSRALQGVIPNLNIKISDGRPTSNPSYNIRGLTSIGAGGSALVLIDGVEGDPYNLNPKDIESVSVLKDAASSAIYGARGAFGVVLITTKTPQKGKPTINFSSSYSANYRTVTPDIVTDAYTYAKMYNETYNAWYDYTKPPTTIGSSGLNFSQDYLAAIKYRSEHPGELPEVDIDPATGEYVYYGNTDWYNKLYVNNTPAIDNSLIISGGSDKIDYSISGRYFSQDGLYKIRSDNYGKYDMRFKGSIKVTDWLKFTNNINYSGYKYSDPFAGTNIWSLMNTSGLSTPMAVMFNPDGSLTKTAAGGVGLLYGKSYTTTQQNLVQPSVGFELSVIKNVLNIKGDFTYRNSNYNYDRKSVPVPYSVKPNIITSVGTTSLGNTKGTTNYYAYNLYMDYTHSFGQHNFKILLGDNIEMYKYKSIAVSRNGLIIEDLSDFNVTTGDVYSITGGGNEWSTTGLFSRINYDFKQKYLVEIDGRYDGSSKFPSSERFGFFPSISVGWRINEESFLKDITSNWLDNLKLRTSYGSLGNGEISPYLYVEQIKATKSSRILNGQLPYYTTNPSVLPDNFTWETSTTMDFGLDIDLFKSKLSGSFDWYKRTTTDMITAGPTLPVVFGATIPKGNYADLETKGFELSLRWNDQINTRKPIYFGVRVTLADNISYITKYNNPTGLLVADPNYFTVGYYQGMRVGDIWGYETEGLFTSEEDVTTHANQSAVMSSNLSKALPGDVKFKDLNNDGKINKGSYTLSDHGDWTIIGNTTPRYSYGVTIDCNWNNFSISTFFQGVGKMDWYPPYGSTEFWGQYTVWYASIPKHTLKNAYTLDNPDPNSYWPRYKAPSPYGERGLQAQTRYLQNASYIRLKDLTISYSLPQKIVERIKLTNVRFFFTGQNIWTYSPIYKITKDVDPEAITVGQGNQYPILKTYTLGVDLLF
ncbi:MAG: TonB-dependent receptor [Bacteroidales bacterium]|nr:TonB-dependent receptor [Bacteroidales bacterium]